MPRDPLKVILKEEIAKSMKEYHEDLLVLDDALTNVVWRIGLKLSFPRVFLFEFGTEKQITTDRYWPSQEVKLEARFRYGFTPDECDKGKEYKKDEYDGRLVFMSGSRNREEDWMEKILLPIIEEIVRELGATSVQNE